VTSAEPSARDCTYDLFRNIQRPKIIYAVPEHCPIPIFIASQGWMFDQVLRPTGATPMGFCNRAAQTEVPFNTYYRFQIARATRGASAS
jgi:hypothetical protein